MKKTVWTFGLISGAIISILMLAVIPFHDAIGFDRGLTVGYTTMVIAFLLVYFGVRSYRDNVGHGSIGFGRALAVGSLIALISSVCYVATWELIASRLMPDYLTKYQAYEMNKMAASGASQAVIAQRVVEMQRLRGAIQESFLQCRDDVHRAAARRTGDRVGVGGRVAPAAVRGRQSVRRTRHRVTPAKAREPSANIRHAIAQFKDRYAKEFLVGWRAMDFNGHMANTAYLDLAADVRLAFLADHGFPPTEFRRLAIGPVIRKEELEYFREVNLHDTVTVTYAALAMSADGARFVIENEIWSASGERAATIRSTGGWLDLRARKLVAPPPALLAALQYLPRTPGFVELPLPRPSRARPASCRVRPESQLVRAREKTTHDGRRGRQ